MPYYNINTDLIDRLFAAADRFIEYLHFERAFDLLRDSKKKLDEEGGDPKIYSVRTNHFLDKCRKKYMSLKDCDIADLLDLQLKTLSFARDSGASSGHISDDIRSTRSLLCKLAVTAYTDNNSDKAFELMEKYFGIMKKFPQEYNNIFIRQNGDIDIKGGDPDRNLFSDMIIYAKCRRVITDTLNRFPEIACSLFIISQRDKAIGLIEDRYRLFCDLPQAVTESAAALDTLAVVYHIIGGFELEETELFKEFYELYGTEKALMKYIRVLRAYSALYCGSSDEKKTEVREKCRADLKRLFCDNYSKTQEILRPVTDAMISLGKVSSRFEGREAEILEIIVCKTVNIVFGEELPYIPGLENILGEYSVMKGDYEKAVSEIRNDPKTIFDFLCKAENSDVSELTNVFEKCMEWCREPSFSIFPKQESLLRILPSPASQEYRNTPELTLGTDAK